MAETLRLLMLNPFFYPYQGGTEKHLLEVSKRLAERGHDVTVLTARLPDTKKFEKLYNVNVVRTPALVLKTLPHPLPPPYAVMPQHAVDFQRLARRADVVHGHNRFMYGLTELALVRALGKTLCWTLHNARPEGIDPATDLCGQAFDESMGRIVMRNCDGVIGVSKATLDSTLPEDYAGVKRAVYNGVDERLFTPGEASGDWRKRLGIPRGKKIVLCVCRLVEQKGLVFLIEAMHRVDAAFVLLGRGPLEKELAAFAAKHGLSDKFFPCTERVSDRELVDLYRTADVFVLPSLYEPFGMVIVEAMACGKPVIGTDVGGIPEIIREDTNGFLVPPRSPRALADRINAILENEDKAARFGIAGRKIVENEFTWERTASGYEAFYERVLAAREEKNSKGSARGRRLRKALAKAFLSERGVSVLKPSALKTRFKKKIKEKKEVFKEKISKHFAGIKTRVKKKLVKGAK
jgi:glycosyltransferase involved in cell wall biosynthesis